LTNVSFDAVISPKLKLRAGKTLTSLWLPLPDERQDAYLVLQADENPRDTAVTIKRLSAATEQPGLTP
jgi:hypothetical protein